MVTLPLIFTIIAIVLFLCVTFGVPSRINLTALGLAFWALATIVGGVILSH